MIIETELSSIISLILLSSILSVSILSRSCKWKCIVRTGNQPSELFTDLQEHLHALLNLENRQRASKLQRSFLDAPHKTTSTEGNYDAPVES